MERLPIPAQESMDVANVAAHATPPSCRTRPYSLWIFVLVAVNLFVAAECHIRGGHGPHMDVHRGTVSPPPSPQFDPSHSADVTALAGTTAILNCRVHNIKNHTVSWIRHRDIHLLTVGSYTYTSDQRFRALHMDDSDDWVLKIKFVQIRDSGIYECQISTTPPVSHFIRLKVVKPYTHVLGGPDMYINKGSTINLTCVVEFSPEPPDFIYWNHNDKIISYDSDRGGVTVIIEKGDVTTSSLLIQDARPADSGRYDCNPSNASPANLTVHVLNGEHPAAMQHGGQGTYTSSSLRNILSLLSVLAALHRVLQ
ncbi:zwei Ig domain protein zig-8-like [Penaeus chinensis]|uniref:zwei Ig domain protein zig-8-like n=1 Tax=Penaeus chinensis TaxID=139456 RepID=UPI001FB66FB3|nr:zwei Ig domain protein zig-8-like [Penaeus chinensis]